MNVLLTHWPTVDDCRCDPVPTSSARTAATERPAQREATFVDRVIRGEDDEDSWTGGGNCAWVYNAVAAEFCRTGSRTVVQRHAVVAPTCVSLQRDVLKTHRYHLRQSNCLLNHCSLVSHAMHSLDSDDALGAITNSFSSNDISTIPASAVITSIYKERRWEACQKFFTRLYQNNKLRNPFTASCRQSEHVHQ